MQLSRYDVLIEAVLGACTLTLRLMSEYEDHGITHSIGGTSYLSFLRHYDSTTSEDTDLIRQLNWIMSPNLAPILANISNTYLYTLSGKASFFQNANTLVKFSKEVKHFS